MDCTIRPRNAASRTQGRILGLGLVAAATLLCGAAQADAATAQWTCEAGAVKATVAGKSTLNPVTTGPRTPCTTASAGLPNTTDALGLAPSINAKTAYAVTSATPAGPPITQTIGSAAGVEGLSLTTGGGANVVIGVQAATSDASASCQNNQPVFSANSKVVGLTINGRTVALDSVLSGLLDPVSKSALGAIASVKLNEIDRNATGLTIRAAHIKLLSVVGSTPLADIIVAESQVSSSSACDPNADANKPSGSGGSGSTFGLCPDGATLDSARRVCVITADKTGGAGTITIGAPFTGPAGGKVVSLTLARKRYHSPCLSGRGPKFAVIGTSKADHITGRNQADRILGLGGNDSLDGGRGNDCVDGGTGSDNVSGAIGNDRLFGATGNDHLNGGPGSDRLSGGSGNDTVNAAFGRDRVLGGPGRDFINVATAGPPATVDCGAGKDKVRVNNNEKRKTKRCERKYVFRDR